MRISDWSSDVCSSDLIATTIASASQGYANASASAPTTAASSVNEAVQLLTGSGEVFIIARAPLLSRWLVSATPAPVASMPAPRSPSGDSVRSEEHTSELQSLLRNSYAVFCLKKKNYS